MKRPTIQSSLSISAVAFGTFCLVYALVRLANWVSYKRADSVIGVEYVAYKDHGQIKYDTNRIRMIGTNPVLTVGFLRSSGSAGGVVQPERFLPANAKPGEHVTVLYREEWGLNADSAVIYSFDRVWRKPLQVTLLGVFCIGVGVWFRGRHRNLLKARRENAV